jgi:hypothetical protein
VLNLLDAEIETARVEPEALHAGARRDHLHLVIDEDQRRVLDDHPLRAPVELGALRLVRDLAGLDQELIDFPVGVVAAVRQRRILREEERVEREVGVL